jgi:hypothetical protein
VLRAAGHQVLASDLVDYGDPTHFAGWDFLMELKAPPGCEAIVTNPPFKLADEFVAHAVNLCPLVVMLLRLAFLESVRRTPILEGGRLARVHIFRNRLPRMHRRWSGRRSTSATAFAWFVWDGKHRGPPHVHRVSWVPRGVTCAANEAGHARQP